MFSFEVSIVSYLGGGGTIYLQDQTGISEDCSFCMAASFEYIGVSNAFGIPLSPMALQLNETQGRRKQLELWGGGCTTLRGHFLL